MVMMQNNRERLLRTRPNGRAMPLPRFMGSNEHIRNNIILFRPITKKIILSSLAEEDVATQILNTINFKKETFTLNNISYVFVTADLDEETRALIFTASRITIWDVFEEFIQYMIFLLICSALLYYLGYRFIGKNLEPVEENIRDMEQFIHNAGHELKTPLSVMKSNLQLAQAKNDFTESVSSTIVEIGNMSNLIDALMNLSTLQKNAPQSEIDMIPLLRDVADQYQTIAEKKYITLMIHADHHLRVNANEEHMRILLNNIVGNALKYNKEHGSVTLHTEPHGIQIIDTGIGIDPENIPHVFDRFYRENEVRSTEGWGIGLSLVKKIVDMYGWQIRVESEKGKGTSVSIRFR
jgi:signal transduction histidine kinase